jgi:hypothetical protein
MSKEREPGEEAYLLALDALVPWYGGVAREVRLSAARADNDVYALAKQIENCPRGEGHLSMSDTTPSASDMDRVKALRVRRPNPSIMRGYDDLQFSDDEAEVIAAALSEARREGELAMRDKLFSALRALPVDLQKAMCKGWLPGPQESATFIADWLQSDFGIPDEPPTLPDQTLTREVERRREAEAKAHNLATMLRRFIWQAEKSTGDTSFKVLAGKARELVERYGLTGEILRDEADAAPLDRQGGTPDA